MPTPWFDGPIWQPFLWTPQNPAGHSGIDIGMSIGTPLTALLPSQLISWGMEPWGGQINLLCDYPGVGQIVVSYLHGSRFPTGLRAGMSVLPGQIIMYSGEPPSRQYGSGAHCHFEVSRGAQPPYMGHNGPSNPINGQFLLDGAKNGTLGNVAANGLAGLYGTASAGIAAATVEPFGQAFGTLCVKLDEIGQFQDFSNFSILSPLDSMPTVIHDLAAFFFRALLVVLGLALILLALANALRGVASDFSPVALPSSSEPGAPPINPAVVAPAGSVVP